VAHGSNRPQNPPLVSERSTVESSVCRRGRRTTGGRLLLPNRLSPSPVAGITTPHLTTGDLTWSQTDDDGVFHHGTVHAARSRVAANRIRSG